MLWLALRFPHWALDCRAGTSGEAPLVVAETRARRQQIVAASPSALAAGLRRGMSLADARSRVGPLVVIERHMPAEKAGMARLAGWAWRYSHQIHWALADEHHDTARLVFEIGASQRLFGGRRALLAGIRQDLKQTAHRQRAGLGTTPQAALAFARRPARAKARSLADLPITCLALEDHQQTTLHASGITHTAQLLALPPAALAQRFGTGLLDTLSRLQGRIPHGLTLYQRPARYETKYELFSSVENTQGLVFVLRRVFDELAAFLRGADSAIQALCLSLIHEQGPPTHLRLTLSAPSHEARHLERVAHERLERLTLQAPVLEIALKSDRLRQSAHAQAGFWQQPGQQPLADNWPGVLDRLRARLGHDAVTWVGEHADHRPEHATCWQDTPPRDPISDRPSGSDPSPRPLWLFEPPQILSQQARAGLAWVAGPERIESGWWAEGQRRDYFRALDQTGRLVWVFRDLQVSSEADPAYYLHGLFG